MSRIVSGLERDRLAIRAPDTGDRRAVRVRATALGRRVLELGRERRVAFLAERLRALDRDDIVMLGRAAELIERLA